MKKVMVNLDTIDRHLICGFHVCEANTSTIISKSTDRPDHIEDVEMRIDYSKAHKERRTFSFHDLENDTGFEFRVTEILVENDENEDEDVMYQIDKLEIFNKKEFEFAFGELYFKHSNGSLTITDNVFNTSYVLDAK